MTGKFSWADVDCVVANLPWGERVLHYHNTTEGILACMGNALKGGCECAVVTREQLSLDLVRSLGFEDLTCIEVASVSTTQPKYKEVAVTAMARGDGEGRSMVIDRGRRRHNQQGTDAADAEHLNEVGALRHCFVNFLTVAMRL